jgi:hypothetical protein
MPHRLIGEDDGDNQQQSLRQPRPHKSRSHPMLSLDAGGEMVIEFPAN